MSLNEEQVTNRNIDWVMSIDIRLGQLSRQVAQRIEIPDAKS